MSNFYVLLPQADGRLAIAKEFNGFIAAVEYANELRALHHGCESMVVRESGDVVMGRDGIVGPERPVRISRADW